MYEMQTIVTNVRDVSQSVSLSVCHAAKFGGTCSVCGFIRAAFAKLLWPLVEFLVHLCFVTWLVGCVDDRDVCSPVCLSVTRLNLASLCKNGWTNQSCLGWTLLGVQRNTALNVGLNPPQRGRGEWRKMLPVVDPLLVSRSAQARDLKFCVHVDGWESYTKYRLQR